jgi:hypothetical protein
MYKCITGVGGKNTPNVYVLMVLLGKKTTRCVCITGVGGKKHPMCMYYWSWKENTQCVCITGVGRKTPNVYVLLELEGKHPMCMYYWSWWEKHPNMYVLLELVGERYHVYVLPMKRI